MFFPNSYEQLYKCLRNVQVILGKHFILAPNHPCHGLLSRVFQYIMTEMGCYQYSMVIVPLYDTLGPDACSYIIEQGKTLLVFFTFLVDIFVPPIFP